jgi:hypothetical protein
MAERDHDADQITRWVIKKCYRISKPSPDQIARYRYWHAVSRGPGGFTASGPWECWLAREIPLGVTDATLPPVSAPKAPSPKRRGRPPRAQQAQALLQAQLANGPKPGALVEAAAEKADIARAELIRATDALGVRCQRGQWWLPG